MFIIGPQVLITIQLPDFLSDIRSPFGYQTKSPVTERSTLSLDHLITGLKSGNQMAFSYQTISSAKIPFNLFNIRTTYFNIKLFKRQFQDFPRLGIIYTRVKSLSRVQVALKHITLQFSLLLLSRSSVKALVLWVSGYHTSPAFEWLKVIQ